MNTERAFIGFNTDGKEILVYKRDDGTYIDLLSKEQKIYPTSCINLATLMPYNKVMKTFKHKTRRSTIKKYKLNRSKMLDIKDIKIGSVCSIYDVAFHTLCPSTFNTQKLYPTLFIKHFSKYEDIIDGNKYILSSKLANVGYIGMTDGDFCTEIDSRNNLITSNLIESNNRYIEKKKTIELAYKLRNGK